jgi:hypothetical protein
MQITLAQVIYRDPQKQFLNLIGVGIGIGIGIDSPESIPIPITTPSPLPVSFENRYSLFGDVARGEGLSMGVEVAAR